MDATIFNVYMRVPLGPDSQDLPGEIGRDDGVAYYKIKDEHVPRNSGDGSASLVPPPPPQEAEDGVWYSHPECHREVWCSNPLTDDDLVPFPERVQRDEAWTVDAENQVEWRTVSTEQVICRTVTKTCREVRRTKRTYREIRRTTVPRQQEEARREEIPREQQQQQPQWQNAERSYSDLQRWNLLRQHEEAIANAQQRQQDVERACHEHRRRRQQEDARQDELARVQQQQQDAERAFHEHRRRRQQVEARLVELAKEQQQQEEARQEKLAREQQLQQRRHEEASEAELAREQQQQQQHERREPTHPQLGFTSRPRKADKQVAIDTLEPSFFSFQGKKSPMDDSQIVLNVLGQDGSEVSLRSNRSKPLRILMDKYCKLKSDRAAFIAFHFHGRRLPPEQTPEELDLEDGDMVEAELHQIGGASSAGGESSSLS